jgi:hypothetical protein
LDKKKAKMNDKGQENDIPTPQLSTIEHSNDQKRTLLIKQEVRVIQEANTEYRVRFV